MNATDAIAEWILDVWVARDCLTRLSNAELVNECLATDADYLVVTEMMTRLHPGWEDESEPDIVPREVQDWRDVNPLEIGLNALRPT